MCFLFAQYIFIIEIKYAQTNEMVLTMIGIKYKITMQRKINRKLNIKGRELAVF